MGKHVPSSASEPSGKILFYQTEDGSTRIDVRMEEDTVWLSQRDMAELFQTTPQNITQHIAVLFEERELVEAATCKDFLQVQTEGKRQVRRALKLYNLDVIISVGYRVQSNRGSQPDRLGLSRLRRVAGDESQADVHGRLDFQVG